MNYLILPDIHNKVERVAEIVAREKPDYIYALGDWFDSYGDNAEMTEKTALYLRSIRDDTRWRKTFGNHDISYAFYKKNPYTGCSGYTLDKQKIIDKILTPHDWQQFEWYRWLDGWLLSHAGLDVNHLKPNLDPNISTQDFVDSFLKDEVKKANVAINSKDRHWIYGAGRARGGYEKKGGLVWCDFDMEFTPVEGMRSIMGHTPQKEPTWLTKPSDKLPLVSRQPASRFTYIQGDAHLCLDTHLCHYALWDGKSLLIKKV